ncbi:MAG: XdhC family protein, partial [Desulfosarcina sp.]
MNTIAQTAVDLLEREETFVLATIVSHSGSTPRTSGTKMIITADGRGFGTIGGGLLEAGAMSRAVELIRSGRSALMPVDLSHQTVASMDMICGGQAEVLLDCVAPTDVNRSVFRHWQQLLEQGGNGCLLTRVQIVDDSVQAVDHSLITASGVIQNELSLSDDERNQIAAASASASTHTLPVDGGFVVLDPAGWICRAHLFGAGHVSRPTAQLAAQVGFWVSVADDREEYANSDRFPDAREIRVLKSFANCLASPAMGRDDYVVILTRGHLYDKT